MRQRKMDRYGAVTAAMTGLALSVVACDDKPKPPPHDELAAKAAPDGDYVSLSGTVVETNPDRFVLDYGSGRIAVEMDDWDWYPEGHAVLVNDDVIVYGYVDDDFYDERTIEASSVYVRDLGTQFYASGADEEAFPTLLAVNVKVDPSIQVAGKVVKVAGDEFQLDTGGRTIDVNVSSMPYDPLDDEGFQKVTANDRVRVTGQLGLELFSDLDLMADTVVTLQKSEGKKES